MHAAPRRVLRRPQRRRRLFMIVASGLALFFVFFFLLPSDTTAPDDLKPSTVAPVVVTSLTLTQTVAPTLPRLPATTTQVVALETTQKIPDPPTQTQQQTESRLSALRRHYAEDLDVLHALDVFTPRPGEQKVSFAQFTDCLGDLLDVDAVKRRESPRTDPNNTEQLPLLISVTSGNTEDLKAMICNFSVSYKYVVLAQTGDTPEMTPFFDLLVRVFSFTKRLVVLQFKKSVGFAGAVNAGLREALRHPFDEVPFVHLVHNDVRYRGTALRDSVRPTYLDLQSDKAVIARLEAEVQGEPNTHTPLIRQPKGLRAPIPLAGSLPQQRGDAGVLVTSSLLPDRIRYMPAVERQRAFANRLSMVFHNSRGEYTAVYVSRLAVLTVGFFDENFYPAMFDDTDFRWRAKMLGFWEDVSTAFDGATVSFDLDCTNTKADGEGVGSPPLPGAGALARTDNNNNNNHHHRLQLPQKSRLSPAARALLRECAMAFQRSVQFTYMSSKWGVKDFQELMSATPPHPPYDGEVFSGRRHLPLDAWVVDTGRIAKVKSALLDTGVGGFEVAPYNPELILGALP